MTLADLPEIQIKRHIRATRLKLRVEPSQIRVTAPVFCTQKQIQNFIDQSTDWLLKTWRKQQENVNKEDKSLPNSLKLFFHDEDIQIIYQKQKSSFIWDDQLAIAYISDRDSAAYLRAFVIAYAKIYLPICLAEISRTMGLSYVKCSIRQPKTRWGSCSVHKDIMLNSALVLCEKKLVEYVCIHELAHTKHFDHSVNFWNEVEKHDKNYKNNRKTLKSTQMPFWWS